MSEPIASYEWPLRELDFDTLVHLKFQFQSQGADRAAYSIVPELPFYLDSKRELRVRIREGRLIVEFL